MKRRYIFLIGLGIVGGLALAAYFLLPGLRQSTNTATGTQTASGVGQVTTLTLVNSIEAVGSAEALQSESLSWKTTGTVANVYVRVGDRVKQGDVLMTIDPLTAPQSVVQAQIDLVKAQESLDNLLNPSALEIANAQQAVTEAQQTLEDVQQDLNYVQNPVGQSLYDSIEDARIALDTALANQQLERISSDASSVKTTESDMNLAYSRLQRAQTAMDDCLKISCGERVQRENELNNATKAYQTAVYAYDAAKLKYETNVANQTDDVRNAQSDYDQAVANLNAAQLGPNALELQSAQNAVAVAEADLAEKQATLDELLNGADPNDIAAAQADVLAAQATLETLTLKAPFDGEVLEVNYRPGNTASQADVAIVIADRSQLFVEVQVDESDISAVSAGDPVTITFDSLPSLSLNGQVAQVIPIGEAVQGLVKYTVRVDFSQADPRVLLGMTTNASIVTETIDAALVVPIDAIQQDDEGEYVIRLKDSTPEVVRVVSGEMQDNDLVVVSGDLQPGDAVQLGTALPTTTNNGGFGPGGGFDGGGGPPPGAGTGG